MTLTILQTSGWAPWLKTLMSNNSWGYMRGYNLLFWIIDIAAMYFVGLIFMLRSRKIEVTSAKWLYRSFGLFFFIMGITRILFVFAYWVEPDYNFLLALGYGFGPLSLIPLIVTLENWLIKQSRHFFTIITIILTILAFVFLLDPILSPLSRTIQYIGMPIVLLAFLILYIWMIKNSVGRVRQKAIWTLIGIFVFIIGIILDGENIMVTHAVPLIIAPILFLAGIIIIGVSQRLD